MTSAGAAAAAPSARLKKRAAVCTAALRPLTILEPCRTIHTLLDRLVRRPDVRLQLEAEVQIVLRAVLVESPRLILIQRIVLQRRIIEVHAVEGDREVIVHRVAQSGGQGADRILRERRAAVEAAVERRPI